MAFLDKATILSRAKPKVQEIDLPEWGGSVFLREITAGQRDRYDAWQIEQSGASKYYDIRARLLVLCICDPDGNRLFSDNEMVEITNLPAQAIDKLWDAACHIVGLRGDVEKN